MPEVLVPVGRHLFSPDALQAALDKAIPQTALEPGQHGAAAAAIDAEGVKVAVIFTSKDDHWRVRGAYEHDWFGGEKVAGDILYRF
jgi:hypothetical protein